MKRTPDRLRHIDRIDVFRVVEDYNKSSRGLRELFALSLIQPSANDLDKDMGDWFAYDGPDGTTYVLITSHDPWCTFISRPDTKTADIVWSTGTSYAQLDVITALRLVDEVRSTDDLSFEVIRENCRVRLNFPLRQLIKYLNASDIDWGLEFFNF